MGVPKMAEKKHRHYHHKKCKLITAIYVLAAIIWVAICLWLQLFTSGAVGLFVALTPIILFMIAIRNMHRLGEHIEDRVFAANFLSVGLMVTIPLFGMLSRNYNGDKRQFLMIVLLAIVCALLSLVDVWLPGNYLSVTKHLGSILQVYSIFLLIFAIYLFAHNNLEHEL